MAFKFEKDFEQVARTYYDEVDVNPPYDDDTEEE